MNYLLSLNKKIIILLGLFILTIVCTTFLIKLFYTNNNNFIENLSTSVEADITKPKFNINGNSQAISITANRGNFLSNNEILLENNVVFESNKFKIYSDSVVFDKKNMIASSDYKTKFVSKNSSIISNGFNIVDNGNNINFKGKTTLILK